MIVKNIHETVPVIDGLIMIDCWRPSLEQQKDYNSFYVRLLSRLIDFDFKCVINASYNVELNTSDPSVRNTLRTYYWPESKNPNPTIVQNLIKHCGGSNQTSPIVIDMLLDNDHSYMLLEFEDFVHHWQTALDCQVNNWLVVGQAWKNCVHRRPVGLDNIYRNNTHPNLNFYALPEGFKTDDATVTTHKHFQQDNLPWTYIENFGYKLITRFSNHWTQSMDFYRDFMIKQHIALEIHCTQDVAGLIPASDEPFDVNVVLEPKESWHFSHSKFTGAYQLDQVPGKKIIKIWVFDIVEPLNLAVLMNQTNPLYSSFITKNKKIVIFETTRITSTHEIENFVK